MAVAGTAGDGEDVAGAVGAGAGVWPGPAAGNPANKLNTKVGVIPRRRADIMPSSLLLFAPERRAVGLRWVRPHSRYRVDATMPDVAGHAGQQGGIPSGHQSKSAADHSSGASPRPVGLILLRCAAEGGTAYTDDHAAARRRAYFRARRNGRVPRARFQSSVVGSVTLRQRY